MIRDGLQGAGVIAEGELEVLHTGYRSRLQATWTLRISRSQQCATCESQHSGVLIAIVPDDLLSDGTNRVRGMAGATLEVSTRTAVVCAGVGSRKLSFIEDLRLRIEFWG